MEHAGPYHSPSTFCSLPVARYASDPSSIGYGSNAISKSEPFFFGESCSNLIYEIEALRPNTIGASVLKFHSFPPELHRCMPVRL
jgi:hypothetical protein